MVALFKSHFSIGKSILTLDDPKKTTDGGSDSIFKIAKENNLKKIVLVEDSLIGFFEAWKRSRELGINLTFGLRMSVRNSSLAEDDSSEHKVIIFAKNSDGCKIMNKIYSAAFCDFSGYVDYQFIKKIWSEKDLHLAIPFYDSFIHVNNFTFGNAVPDLAFTNPTVFYEDNETSIDGLLFNIVSKFSDDNKLKMQKAKTIYYKNNEDVDAYMSYKIICNRSFGKDRSIQKPNLEHFCSNKFSFQSWKEQNA